MKPPQHPPAPFPFHVASFDLGDLVAGRYRLVRLIARGGMGEVYEAQDTELGISVALKTILPTFADDDRVLGRFKREILLARQVTHPNVCRIFDVGHHGAHIFLSMELLQGETLSQRLKRVQRMTIAEALPLAVQMATALAAAHRAGVVHRDFKSSNVILVAPKEHSDAERAVVTDFGLARALSAETDSASITSASIGPGTPAYMAPEQVEGDTVGPVADIYALGVVLYEMVTGKPPFVGETRLATALMRLSQAPPSPRTHVLDLDPRWETTILRCLALAPADRFQSAEDVIQALHGEEGAEALRAMATRVRPRRSVAVLGFKNLSRREETAWLSTALSEMLTMELGAGEQLRTIPGENVARTKIELSLPDADALAKDTLARLRMNLGTDLVVLGSYFAAGAPAGGKLRLDLRVQDAAAGETIALISEMGTEADFLELVSRAGSRLREKLGVEELSATERDTVQAARPSRPEAARLYAEGLRKLRLFDALAALKLLQRAVAIEPSYALAHSALAEAWSALGYDAKAALEAKKAFGLAANLPREERLLVEGRHHEAAKNWDKAVETYRALWMFFPDNLDYGLRLLEAQTTALKGKEVLATLEALRTLPPPASEDPRIDLAEAKAAASLGESRRRQAAAATAARKGEALEARLIVAWARFEEGAAFLKLGELQKATSAIREAKRIFKELGDRAGLARTVGLFANLLLIQGKLPRARALHKQALDIHRKIGYRIAAAKTLLNIGNVLCEQGDLTGAKKKYQEALRIAREVEDRGVVTASLMCIAVVLSNRGDLIRARRMYEQGLTIAREIGDKWSVASALDNIADVHQRQGNLLQARSTYEEALTLFRQIGDKTLTALVLRGIADVLAGQDDFAASRKTYEKALALRTKLGEKGAIAEVRSALAALSIEEGRLGEAKDLARKAAKEFQRTGRRDDEAAAQNVRARALLDAGTSREAQRALDRALALSKKSQNLELHLAVAVTTARFQAHSARPGLALKTLKAAISKAAKAGLGWMEFEARLAMGESEVRSGKTASGRARLAVLEKEARAKGLLLTARKAKAARLGTARSR